MYYWQISRVNPGSVAAERVREGDLISCINGQDSSGLTNQVRQPSHHYTISSILLQEAKTILNTLTDKLTLKLHNKRGCGEEQKKRSIVARPILPQS